MILAATAVMAFQDAIVKLLSATMPLWQLFLLRSLIAIPLLLAMRRPRHAWSDIRAATSPWLLARSLLLVFMYVAFYAALPMLDLSVVAACYYTAPIFIVLLTAAALKERVPPNQLLAIGVAFCGVLIILHPTGDVFSFFMLIPLASALFYALAAVITRGRTSRVSPWTLTLSLNLCFAALGTIGVGVLSAAGSDPSYPFLLTAWTPLGADAWASLALLAVISIGIHLALARAYQAGPTSVVASFDYAYLVFAAIWGFVLFGTIPDVFVISGTIIIAASGWWMTVERRRR